MQRFDRYVLSQLLVLFGFFSLVLVAVYWVNRAVVLFDQLISDGHSAGIFLEFTALSLPSVVAMVMPMSSFAAAVYVANRLSQESELTVMQATGFSPWRLVRPALVFGLLIAVMMSLLNHLLVPQSREQFREREQEIAASVSARLLREGVFLHPSDGVTFFFRDMSPEGELSDVFLSDRREADREIVYTANQAFLIRDSEGAKMVMLAGQAQTFDTETGRLATTSFADLTYDIAKLIVPASRKKRKLDTIPTWELLTRTQAVVEETGERAGEVAEVAHMRLQTPLLCIVSAVLGFAALLVGGYSRFGATRQIVGAIFLLVLVKLVEGAVTEPVRSNAALWPLVYLPSLLGLGMALVLIRRATRPFRPRRRPLAPPQESPA